MTLTPEQTKRFNALIWAFDAGTAFRYDNMVHIPAIIAMARLNHLDAIANELETLVELNSL